MDAGPSSLASASAASAPFHILLISGPKTASCHCIFFPANCASCSVCSSVTHPPTQHRQEGGCRLCCPATCQQPHEKAKGKMPESPEPAMRMHSTPQVVATCRVGHPDHELVSSLDKSPPEKLAVSSAAVLLFNVGLSLRQEVPNGHIFPPVSSSGKTLFLATLSLSPRPGGWCTPCHLDLQGAGSKDPFPVWWHIKACRSR
ncbi:hypothetical protein HJG60_009697 [Phyllostomus discolor]|uniref:Uncharacterized protein n=1 Tax=Phyllostomus discolor TaxID=89673 RepID=A0A834B2E3_9CHIR|nr:hypothetical protein HJG60_009697 [Phyllostomus discolor]